SIFDSYSRRPMTVDLPSSTEPQVMKRSRLFFSCCFRYFSMSVAIRSDWWAMSFPWIGCRWMDEGCLEARLALEIAFLLLLLHRGGRVVVDHAALALRGLREQHLLDDRGQRVGLRLHGARQRVAAQRAEAHALHHRHLALAQRHAVVV